MKIRNYRDADFAPMLTLANRLETYGQLMTEEDFRARLAERFFTPGKDILLVDDAGVLRGFLTIMPNPGGVLNRHYMYFRLEPELFTDYALVDELLGQAETRIHEIAKKYQGPLQIRTWSYDNEKSYSAAFERNGFIFNRYYARLDLHDISQLQEPELTPGVTIRLFLPPAEDEKYMVALNESFTGHFEHREIDLDEFRSYQDKPYFQPELMFAAVADDEFIGVSWNYMMSGPEADGLLWGVVEDLGVVPAWRGKGLGRALIRAGMLALRAKGAQKICLWVDYANPHGAKQLYYSEGFVDKYIEISYQKDEE
jgi:mycothiol synthase